LAGEWTSSLRASRESPGPHRAPCRSRWSAATTRCR
jgi:hypothetical protein